MAPETDRLRGRDRPRDRDRPRNRDRLRKTEIQKPRQRDRLGQRLRGEAERESVRETERETIAFPDFLCSKPVAPGFFEPRRARRCHVEQPSER